MTLTNTSLYEVSQKVDAVSDYFKNVKADLATKVGGNASASFADIISNIALGKKWAEGKATSQSEFRTFYVRNSSNTLSKFQLVVSGLTFKPSIILMWCNDYYLIVAPRQDYPNEPYVLGTNAIYNPITEMNSYDIKKATSYIYMNSTGFSMPTALAGKEHGWIAFE